MLFIDAHIFTLVLMFPYIMIGFVLEIVWNISFEKKLRVRAKYDPCAYWRVKRVKHDEILIARAISVGVLKGYNFILSRVIFYIMALLNSSTAKRKIF